MLRHGISQALTTSGRPDTVIVLRKGSDNELSSAITNEALQLLKGGHAEVAQLEGGAAVIGEVVVVLAAERSDGSGAVSNVSLRATSADALKVRPGIKVVEGRAPKPGTNEVMVGKGIAGRFKGMGMNGTFDMRHNRPLQ